VCLASQQYIAADSAIQSIHAADDSQLSSEVVQVGVTGEVCLCACHW
jgi:hypothetical protein